MTSTCCTFQFTQGLALICKLPQDLDIVKKLNNDVITLLYNSLPHPPATYIGTDYAASTASPAPPTNGTADSAKAASTAPSSGAWGSGANGSTPAAAAATPATPRIGFAYRRADGSGNNPNMVHLGKSETPYARDVESKFPLPKHVLPDSGMVFDALLKANDVSSPARFAIIVHFNFFYSVYLFRLITMNDVLVETASGT